MSLSTVIFNENKLSAPIKRHMLPTRDTNEYYN